MDAVTVRKVRIDQRDVGSLPIRFGDGREPVSCFGDDAKVRLAFENSSDGPAE
jgi:hypothetical protein